MFKDKNWGRDLLFAFVLVALIRHVKDDCSVQRETITYENIPAIEDELDHEEQQFVSNINTLKKQIKLIKEKLNQLRTLEAINTLRKRCFTLQKELDTIYNNYFKLSPTNVMLGPIGAVSRVMRERQLRNDLNSTADRIGKLARKIALDHLPNQEIPPFKSYMSIDEIIAQNDLFIRLIN